MITFQLEKLSDVKEEALPLLQKHWEEIALNKEVIPLDPDWHLYNVLEVNNILNITTARDDNKLIGYFAYLIVPNLHYQSLRIAEGDIFYIDPEYRRSGVAIKLLKESEKNVKAAGANKIVNKTKEHFENIHGNAAGLLFQRAGYIKIESIWAKLI